MELCSRKGALSGLQMTLNELNPEDYLRAHQLVSAKSLQLLKCIYDFTKREEPSATSLQDMITFSGGGIGTKKRRKNLLSKTEQPLDKLITDSFDGDQVWEELQLQNKFMYETLISCTSKIMAKNNSIVIKSSSAASAAQSQTQSQSGRRSSLDQFVDDDDEELDDSEEDESATEFEGNDRKRPNSTLTSTISKTYSKSIVDDRFFNLAQMTEYLERVEAQMEVAERADTADDEVGSEDDIDMFADEDGAQEETETPETGEDGYNVYYNAYFDAPLDQEQEKESDQDPEEDDEDEDIDQGDEVSGENKKTVRFNVEEGEDDEDEGEDFEEEAAQVVEDNPSNFEKKRRKIEENISQIEANALEAKPWKYQGEITAGKRPENSLLEEHLVYDSLVRQAPEITVETTLKLEDIIKQRIKDKSWDDVERKLKPIEDPNEFKKKLVLSAEKSKMSLAQIYEQEYISQKKADEGETEVESKPEEELIIEKDLKTLLAKLDALSNFHYTPKPATAELKIVTNSSAIAMEEVAPVNVADSTLLAPHEIQDPVKGDIKGKAERTDTDKKHERRVKKKVQKLKYAAREAKDKLKGVIVQSKISKIGTGKKNKVEAASGITPGRKNQIKFK